MPNLIHISSSVVNSKANDFYSKSKREQEELVINSGIPCHILRPTLMFGWFDRKHLGWLSRFMSKVPIFPIPGMVNISDSHYMLEISVRSFLDVLNMIFPKRFTIYLAKKNILHRYN